MVGEVAFNFKDDSISLLRRILNYGRVIDFCLAGKIKGQFLPLMA